MKSLACFLQESSDCLLAVDTNTKLGAQSITEKYTSGSDSTDSILGELETVVCLTYCIQKVLQLSERCQDQKQLLVRLGDKQLTHVF